MTKEEILEIAQNYAKEHFSPEFVSGCSDSWYYEALNWFDENYGYEVIPVEFKKIFGISSDKINKVSKPSEREEFGYQIDRLFKDTYNKHFGKQDDYLGIKVIKDNLQNELNNLVKIQSNNNYDIDYFVEGLRYMIEQLEIFLTDNK